MTYWENDGDETQPADVLQNLKDQMTAPGNSTENELRMSLLNKLYSHSQIKKRITVFPIVRTGTKERKVLRPSVGARRGRAVKYGGGGSTVGQNQEAHYSN